MKWCLSAVLIVAVAACKGPGHSRPVPQTHLEHSLFFAERDTHGAQHAISAQSASSTKGVERTADGATVDVNSKLQLHIEDALAGAGRGAPVVAPAQAAALGADIAALTDALDNVAKLREAEVRALRAWERYDAADPASDEAAAAYPRFVEAKNALATARKAVLEPVRRLWPVAQRTKEVDDMATALITGEGGPDVVAPLRAKLAELAQRSSKFEEDVRERAASDARRLRIEAFLVPSEGAEKSHAVHVPGYDNLDQGEIQRIDPLGLRLTQAEREALQQLMTDSRKLANALERVRKGEATLTQALSDAGGPLFDGIQALIKDLEGLDVAKRIDATKAALSKFLKELEVPARQFADSKTQAWDDALASFLSQSNELAELSAEITEVLSLRDEWSHVTAEKLPELIERSLNAIKGLQRSWGDRSALVKAAGDLLNKVESDIATLPAQVKELVEPVWKNSALKADLEEWRALVTRIGRLAERLANAVGLTRKPVRTNLQNVDVIDVPIGEARDTQIDLRRTTRKAGDHLEVRARVLGPGADDKDAEPPLEATFELRKLGWHADLIPSIVFVEGDQVAGADDSGGFSTALNWMWSYGPRDDDDDPHLSRSLAWGVGLHAVFLNFGPDNDAEIGLGVTASLWDQRLQFGIGYNPMADSDDDGRVYYFIGSSLVPLLQALTRD